MSVITQLNSAPYFDDYSPEKLNPTTGLPEVDKDFLRILFRPGYAVQARELNQVQSILQMQVERFGKHIFKEGSIVIGGLSTIDTQTPNYLTILDTYSGNPVVVSQALGLTATGVTSGAIGLVTVVADNDGTEPKTLIYKPLNGISFQNGEDIQISGLGSWATVRTSNFTGNDSVNYPSQGNSSTVSIDEGIFFSKGTFVINAKQTTYLAKYSNTPNKIAGLLSEIQLIDESIDTTLLDNASGSYNYAAPGAHRLKINLVLTSKDPGYTADADKFIQILEVRDGSLYKQINRPTYNELAKVLARRTFDESGDYTVRPFIMTLEDYSAGATGSVRGRISAGKAYVKGFEVETIATQDLDIPKARTTETYTGADAPVTYGNYVSARSVTGLPNINSLEKLYLYDQSGATGPIGYARVRDIQYNGSTGPNYNLYLFDTAIQASGKTFNNVLYMATGATGFQYSGSQKQFQLFNSIGATGMGLINPGTPSLVYNTGYTALKTLSNINLTYRKYYSSVSVSGGTTAAIQSGSSRERFQGTAGTVLSSTVRDTYYIVTDATTGAQLTNYTIALDSPGAGSQQTATLTFTSQANPINIIGTINNNNANPNTKTLKALEFTEGYFAAPTVAANTVTLPSTASSTDNYYTNGSLKITSGTGSGDTVYTITGYTGATRTATLSSPVTVTIGSYFKISPFFNPATSYTGSSRGIVYSSSPTGTISLNVSDITRIVKIINNVADPSMKDWFDSSKDVTNQYVLDNGQRDNYYDIGSVTLKSGQTVTGPVVIFFEYFTHGANDGFFCVNSYPNRDIPYYYKDSSGNNIDLFNAIDCRPTKSDSSTFVSTTLASANTNFGFNSQYYLPRIDKVAITVDGIFVDVQGVPSINPKEPKDIDNGLSLYSVYVPAYTYSSSSIFSQFIENKRYTMRDIGKLEKRIENIEYYTSLTALEQNTSLFNVRDTDGKDRFKNGILVDTFNGHNIGDVYDQDYHCSIDMTAQEMRPEFTQKTYGLSVAAGSTGFYQRGDLITSPFSDVLFVNQPAASRSVNVNPFSVFNWIGKLTLTPNNDFWKDTTVVPTNVNNQNGFFDNLTNGTNPSGSLFNQWNNMWFGTRTETIGFASGVTPQTTVTNWQTVATTNTSGAASVTVVANVPNGGSLSQTAGGGANAVTQIPLNSNQPSQVLTQQQVTTVIPASTWTMPITQTVRVPVPPPIKVTTVESGQLVKDVVMAEYIRPKVITFSATGMKPSTTIYPFFDGKVISQYVTPTGGSLGGVLTTDASGFVSGTFAIPVGVFFVGDRILLLTDSSTANRSQETTSAEAKYTAEGLEQTSTTLNIPISLPDPNAPFWTQNQQQQPPRPIDPLAETFFVDPIIYPEGIFISKVDLFFKTKDTSIPLTVQIRDTVNGYPSSTSVLVSTSVPAASINTSTDASVATTVTFPNVVYLSPGEYSIVLISNSNNYETWVAQIGENQIGTTNLIVTQPYVGSLFKSQNASTWTAEQTQDLTFKLYRCSFSTAINSTVWTDWDATLSGNNVVIPTVRTINGATGFNTYSAIGATGLNTITIVGHPYATGSPVTYSKLGATGFTGLTNGSTYYANRVNSDVFKLYDTSARATIGGATGLIGLTPCPTSPTSETHGFSGGARVLYLSGLYYNSIKYGSGVTGTGIASSTTVTGGSVFDNTAILSNDITTNIPSGTSITFQRKSEGNTLSDVIMVPNATFSPFSSATVNQSFKATTVSSGVLDASWTPIITNKNFNFTEQHKVDTAAESFQKKIDVTTTSEYVSPVINATRQSIVHIGNVINNDSSGETSSSGGNSIARYLTRKITLSANSSYLKIYLTANKPSGSDVQVYYKVRSSSDSTTTLASKSWVQMVQNSPTTAAFSADPNEFLEYVFLPNDLNTSTSSGTRKISYTFGGATYSDFIEYAIKIVLISPSTSYVPRVADFRVIAVE